MPAVEVSHAVKSYGYKVVVNEIFLEVVGRRHG